MTRSPLAEHWLLDPAITFLNHGSFGACPRVVLDEQSRWRERMEREPVLFLHREIEGLLDSARGALAQFVGAQPDDLAFVVNATTGVNTVLRSVPLVAGDEVLVTDQEYNACRNALDHIAARRGARVVVAHVPFPLRDEAEVIAPIVAAVTPRTRLLLVDFVTSQTGLVMPIRRIVEAMHARGVAVLVDGAHAPGMVPLELDALGAEWFTGNCHKWLCTPKGSAFLHVRRDRQAEMRPLVISHGANSRRSDRSRFRIEADWIGTHDPTPWLCIPTALRFLGGLMPGGIEALRAHNRSLVLEGRRLVCEALGIEAPAPEAMIGSLASIPLPPGKAGEAPLFLDPLQVRLFDAERIELPIMGLDSPPRRLLRISAQAYNARGEYVRLAAVLPRLLRETAPD
ncbi:MAG: aminotransferase class V-fold PLP-dependent enzyme [Planctomycetes bacterium]|nr:aminotransferase class V-fold PLP-dependent enzyme [Planctomycetota bacterium]